MDAPPPPPLITAPPSKKGLSTGCIVALVLAIVAGFGLAVMGILAAMAVPTMNRIAAKAAHFKSMAAAKDISLAVRNYFVEYGRYPAPPQATIVEINGDLLAILCGKNVNQLNPRQIAFVEPPIAKNGKGGIVSSGGSSILVDYWGHPYRALMDFDGDGSVPDPEHSGATMKANVLIWSAGEDGNLDTWADNVKSW